MMSEDGAAAAGRLMSLRAQVSLVIAGLSILPNLVMLGALLLPIYQSSGIIVRQLWVTLGVWLLLVVVVSGGVGYLIARQLLAPLAAVTRDISALPIAASRISRVRLPVTGREPGEVFALKRSFNHLLAQVQLEQSRRQAFLATLMHDMKTPLIAAGHLLSVVRDNEGLSREERIRVVSQLSEENRALIELLQKLVDAQRLELETIRLERRVVDLAALLHSVVSRVEPIARDRGVVIEVRGNSSASVDPNEFQRALYNLVTNAVRYARSRVTLELYQGLIRLTDDGPGLPAPLEELAQPFNARPVEIAGRRFAAGTGGLGLFIARRIIDAHGGKLITEASHRHGTVLLIYLGTNDE